MRAFKILMVFTLVGLLGYAVFANRRHPAVRPFPPELADKIPALRDQGTHHMNRFYKAVEGRDVGALSLGEPIPWYSPRDPDGAPVAAEFPLSEGDKPAGYVILSLDPNSPRVMRFESAGGALSERLNEVARERKVEVERPMLLNGIAIARMSDARIVTELGADIDAKTFLQSVTEAPPESAPVDDVGSTSSALSMDTSNLTYDCKIDGSTPLYRQFDVQRVVTQPVGCGATAWGIVLGWVSERAFDGDPVWGPLKGVMREGGAAKGDRPAQRAASRQGEAEETMMTHIMESLGSFGTSSGTPTTPGQMADVMNYLGNVGLHTSVRVDSFHYGGGHFSSIWKTVKRNICDWKTPTVMGVGHLEHYVVGIETYQDSATKHVYIRLNTGWGSVDDFDRFPYYGIFLAATIIPKHVEEPAGSLVAFGKCADVRGGPGMPNGTPLQLYGCHGGPNQRWRLGTTGQLANAGGRCLVQGTTVSGYADDAHIQDCDSSQQAQRFTPTDIKIFTKERLCLDASATSGVRGAACSNAPSQRFTYLPSGILKTGEGKCLTTENSPSPGSPLAALDCDGGRPQVFWFGGDGTLRAHNENCVTVDQQGATVDACVGSDQQDVAFRGEIKSYNGRCLDVLGSGTADQTPLQIHDCNQTDAQQWTFAFKP